jgi:dihydroxy-acid dehydratase
LRPAEILTPHAFHNAIVADMAVGGSTNAIIHLVAMAARAGVSLTLEQFDEISRRTPRLADLRPAGRFLMEDFYFAGGLRALLAQFVSRGRQASSLSGKAGFQPAEPGTAGGTPAGPDRRDACLPLLHADALTVNGRTLGENLAGAEIFNPEVIRPLSNPCSPEGGTAILRGNLAPRGAVIKHAAMEERFLKHTGPAVVFRDYNDLAARIDDPALPVTGDSVIVLQNAGPKGAPGMPEWGMLPIPRKLLEQGVRDMVRVSDARMSGTSYGACVLHVAPESAIGGPLALVRDGDSITLDVPARRIDVNIPDSELSARRVAWKARPPQASRGFLSLFLNEVTQADEGCDFRFLHRDTASTEPEIH